MAKVGDFQPRILYFWNKLKFQTKFTVRLKFRGQWLRNGASHVSIKIVFYSNIYTPPLFYLKLAGSAAPGRVDSTRRPIHRWRRRTRLLGAVEKGKAWVRSPCNPNYCRNGGECKLDKRQHSGFRCVCKSQYSGLRCDNGI